MRYAREPATARRGTFPFHRGGARGVGRTPLAVGRGRDPSRNYMSSNQYYSLMGNEEFEADGCGEKESSVMEEQPYPEDNDHIPSPIDGGTESQLIVFQGESSTSQGTILPC